jgi:hypothetical protein
MNLLNLINSSLAYVYCSTTLSNHELIRLMDSSRELVSIYAISFIVSLYLVVSKHPVQKNRIKFSRVIKQSFLPPMWRLSCHSHEA